MGGVDLLGSSPPGYPQVESQDKQNNPLLVNLLDSERGLNSSPAGGASGQGQGGPAPISESPMLSRLLDDNISVATNITPISVPSQPQTLPKPKGTKGRKRRSQSDLAAGRSPKRLVSDSDNSERYGSIDLESSSSPFESSLGGSGGLTGFHHQMGQGQVRPPSQGHMSSSVIDLTEENAPHESSLKKLFDFSNEGFMPSKDLKPGGSAPESELHALLSKQDHSNSPSAALKPNQVTGPKNENASTSPEGLLIGSGEVGKASLPDPLAVHHKMQAHGMHTTSPPTTLAAFLGHGPTAAKARRDSDTAGLHTQPGGGAFPHQELNNPLPHHFTDGASAGMVTAAAAPAAAAMASRPKVVCSSSMTEMLDVKPVLPPGKKGGGLKASASTDPLMDKRGLFEKFDFTGQTASTAHITITSSSVTTSSGGPEGEDVPKVRLKLQNFRAPHSKSQSLDSSVVQSPSSAGSKSSNSNTFDFHSDEDDDEPISINMNYHVPSERLAVYASSPTRLQISSKVKPPTPVSTPESSPSVKPEKYKRKDKSSGNAKRKKDRDESKKERKKKKLDRDLYQPPGKELTYRASTVETDQKTGTKLKIRVSKEILPKVSSPVKESSRMELNSEKVGKFSERVNDAMKRRPTPSSPGLEKLVLQKQDIKDMHMTVDETSRDRELAQLYRSSPTGPGRPLKSGSSGKGGSAGSNSGLGKADPKLAKATIRLKPLNITSSTSTSLTVTQPTKTTASSRSVSDRSERRSQSMSVSTPVSTPTSSTMTLSSILPDAPTASIVASLPKIPKVSSQNSAAAAATTSSVSATGTKPSPAVANNSIKNSTMNSTFNNALNKGSGSPGMGGGRSGSNPNIPNATKSPNMGFNKAGVGGMQKSSPGMPGHKASGTTAMPPGILKNSGNVSQGSGSMQKTATAGNQGLQKGAGGPNQLTGSYNRGPVSSSQTGGVQKSVGAVQGLTKNMANQVAGVYKSAGVQGGGPRGPSTGNQGLQKGNSSLQKSPNVANQGASTKLSGSPNQNMGPQKTVQGKTAGGSPVTGSNKPLTQGSSLNQKNSAQGSNFTSKPQGSAGGNSTGVQAQGQKLAGNQGRSMSTSSYNSSPNSGGRPAGTVRNNSVSGGSGGGGGRTPPNHLPVNRPMSAPGQKAGSGSSPRTSGQSPSNPSAPRFPGNSPQQKNSGASPSSVSQRSGSTSQTSSQRSTSSSNTSQPSGNQRPSSVSSQRSSTSPQTQRSALVNPGSSPNQRPASTPGPGSDSRLSSNGPSQSPGYPARPSSAGPRQSSSPMGPNSGQSSTSIPSGTRTASPSGHGQRGNSGGGSGSSVSSLVSGQSAAAGGSGGGGSEKAPLSRQNSTGSLVSSAVSRQNSSGSLNAPVVSRQNSSGSVNPPPVSRQNSSGSLNSAVSRQTTSNNGKTPAIPRQNSSGSLNPPAVSKQDTAGAGSRASLSVSRQGSTTGSSVAMVSKQNTTGTLNTASVSQQNSSVSSSVLAVTRQNSSGSLGTSAISRQNSNSGGSSSAVSSASRQLPATSTSLNSTTSTAATPQLTSSTTPVAMTQMSAQSGTILTSSSPITTSSTTSPSTVVSAAKTPSTVTHNTQRTSSSVVSMGSLVSANKTSVPGNKTVTTKTPVTGPVSMKTSHSSSGGPESSGAVMNEGASSAKANTTTTGQASVKLSVTASITVSPTGSITSSAVMAKAGASATSSSAIHTGTSSVTSSGLKAQTTVSLTSSSSSSSAATSTSSSLLSLSSTPSTVASAVTSAKSLVAGAARGRKGSLSAIVNKLATKMGAASGSAADGGETAASGDSVTSKAAEVLSEVHKGNAEDGAETKTGVKRSASLSGLSPPSSDLKVQRVDAHTKPAPTTPTTPTTPTPAHTPPHISSLPLAGVERRRSGSVGEPCKESEEVGLDLSLPKDKAKPEPLPAPLPPPRPDSRGRVSPKDSNPARSGSPAVGTEKISGMKFNGDSSKDKCRSENEVFKVPTPKTTEESEERGVGGSGGSKVGRNSPVCNAVSRPPPAPASPLSDASSPDNELVIDCEESVSLTNSRPPSASSKAPITVAPINPSPKRVAELASESPTLSAAGRASPGLGSGKNSPSPSARSTKNSPQLSPHPKPSPSPAPNDTGANSPCEIDDDLMDAALMGFNAS